MMRYRRTHLAIILGLAVTLGGCAGHGRVTFHDENMDFSLVQTIAVMPFANMTVNSKAAERVRDLYMTMLQATGGLYVLPPGEVNRGISRASIKKPTEPTSEEVVQFASLVKADAVIVGSLLEYGQVRSGSTSANIISISLKLMEASTGRIVWSAASTAGGVGAGNRLFGGGGKPMNAVTEEAINDLLDKLFKD